GAKYEEKIGHPRLGEAGRLTTATGAGAAPSVRRGRDGPHGAPKPRPGRRLPGFGPSLFGLSGPIP
ncbi:MAG TPA: hypothetical protein VMW90_09035, partial [Acidobacteriota bacterium]|nr:hypothetical protein [Acidobacteriota bacterium]